MVLWPVQTLMPSASGKNTFKKKSINIREMLQRKTDLTHKRTVINESQNILIYVYYLYTIRDIFSLLRNYDKIKEFNQMYFIQRLTL